MNTRLLLIKIGLAHPGVMHRAADNRLVYVDVTIPYLEVEATIGLVQTHAYSELARPDFQSQTEAPNRLHCTSGTWAY